MSNQKIGTVEAIMMILAIVVSHTLLYLPKNILSFMKSASILNIIYVSIFAILIAYLIYRLLRNFPGLDIIDISEFVGGKLFKNIIGIIFILYFITSFSMFLRSFCESIKIIYYPMTNIFFILSFFIIAICIANRLDFNATLKTTLIILPIVLISVIFLFLTNLGQFTPQRMFPIFGEGIYNTFVLGLVNLYSFAGIEYIYFLPPFLKKPENMKKILLISIGISALYLLLSVATLLFIFAFLFLITGVSIALKIETEEGYYECQKCHHKYIPSYRQVYFAMHIGRTRYMKCPHCQKRSWQKKIYSK